MDAVARDRGTVQLLISWITPSAEIMPQTKLPKHRLEI